VKIPTFETKSASLRAVTEGYDQAES